MKYQNGPDSDTHTVYIFLGLLIFENLSSPIDGSYKIHMAYHLGNKMDILCFGV